MEQAQGDGRGRGRRLGHLDWIHTVLGVVSTDDTLTARWPRAEGRSVELFLAHRSASKLHLSATDEQAGAPVLRPGHGRLLRQ